MNRLQLFLAATLFLAIVLFAALSSHAQTVHWVRQAGTSGNGYGVSSDADGNVYATGTVSDSAKFDTLVFGAHFADMFIAKYDNDGILQWAHTGGNNLIDEGRAIATDANGNSFVVGYYNTNPIYTTVDFSGDTLVGNGSYDFFIAMYDAGGDLMWIKQGGSSLGDYGYGVTIDGNGGVYACGAFQGTATFGTQTITSSGMDDIFVAKYDYNGNLIWITTDGGSGSDQALAITYNEQIGLAVTGQFQTTALFGTTSLTTSGLSDVFTARYDLSGNNVWAEQGGGGIDFVLNKGTGIDTDPNGNVYVTGEYAGMAHFGAVDLVSTHDSSYVDVFTVKYDADGNVLWARGGGGSTGDKSGGITVDIQGNSYITGQLEDGADAVFDTVAVAPFGNDAVFIAKYNTDGDILFVKRYAAGNGAGIAMTQNNCLLFTGGASGNIGVPIFDTVAFYYVDRSAFIGKFCDEFVPTSVLNVKTNDGLTLFPNPTNGQLTLQSNDFHQPAQIEVYNSLMQQVKTITVNNANQNIEVSELQNGIYFLKANVASEIFTRQFVVMK